MKFIMTLVIASFFQQRYTNFLLECHKNNVFWACTTRVCVAHENGMPISTQNDLGHVLVNIFELNFGACDYKRNTKFFVIATAPGQ